MFFGNNLILSQASLYNLLGGSETVCSLRANCSPQLRQGLPEYSTQCPGIRRFSNLAGWEQALCWPCGSAQYCYSWSFWVALSPASASFLTCTVFGIQLNMVEEPFVDTERPLSMQPSPLWSSVLRTLASLLSLYYQLHLLNSGSLSACVWSPLPVPRPGSSLKVVSWGNHRAHLIYLA